MRFVKNAVKMSRAAICVLLLGSGLLVSRAQAGYVVTFKQVGSDVIATGSGPIDLTDLTFLITSVDETPFVLPDAGWIVTGPANPNGVYTDNYRMAFDSKVRFGPGQETDADSGSGDIVGAMTGSLGDWIIVPNQYVSGNPLSNTSTYLNQTFDSLGMTPGSYVRSWGPGEHQNFTIIVGDGANPSPIPEPSSAFLLGTALVGLIGIRYGKKRPINRS
jgi:hypothetical protein